MELKESKGVPTVGIMKGRDYERCVEDFVQVRMSL